MSVAAPTRHQVEEFRETIPALLGLHFDDSRLEDVAAALRQRLRETGCDAASYLTALRGPGARREACALAELLTVCETYFLRNAEQFRALAEVALPELLERRAPSRALSLLSAGCSSGEEPFSIAMVLRESFPEIAERRDVRVVGIDVNPARLARARAGCFSPWSLRAVPDAVRDRWFRPRGRELELDARIRRAVRFEERNLLDDDPAFWQPGAFDAVFFRNVGMYLHPEVMRAVISRIARSLSPGGFLFLGHAETLRAVSHDFQLRQSHECFYYQVKEPGALAPWPAAPPGDDAAPAPGSGGAWVDAIRRSSERIAALEARPATGREVAAPAPGAPRAGPVPDLGLVLELMREERMAEALDALPQQAAPHADAELLRAVLLASCGRLEEAERTCARLLRLDDLNAGAHYVAALCREHAGDRQGAREHDRAAAYLDPGFAMPRLHLGLLARRAGDHEAARPELRQAEVLLEREEPARLLLFGGGFRREALLELCRAELRACGAPR